MTEEEWLRCLEPQKMVDFAGQCDRASARKVQLFLCACVRRVWHLLKSESYRQAVELSEQAADGLITDAVIEDAWMEWIDTDDNFGNGGDAGVAALAATGVSVRWDWEDAHQYAARASADMVAEEEAQNQLVRCIMGDPFRPLPAIRPEHLVWNDSTVPKLARAIYEERAFDRLPILADALEEAGCTEETVLAHLRSPGPHARGCWPVDLILGKS